MFESKKKITELTNVVTATKEELSEAEVIIKELRAKILTIENELRVSQVNREAYSHTYSHTLAHTLAHTLTHTLTHTHTHIHTQTYTGLYSHSHTSKNSFSVNGNI